MTLLGSLLNIPVFWLVGTLIYLSTVWVLAFPKLRVSSYAYSARHFQQQMIPYSSIQIPGVLSLSPGILFQCYLPSQHSKSFNPSESNFCLHCVSEVLSHAYFILPHYTRFQKIILARKSGQPPHWSHLFPFIQESGPYHEYCPTFEKRYFVYFTQL